MKRFEQLIAKHSGKVNFREFLDEDAAKLEKLVAKKQKSHVDVVKSDVQAEEDAEGGEVVDLLEVLSRSLGGATGRKSAKKAATRKPSAVRKK